MDELSRIWSRLHDAEYLHLYLEPLPLLGTFFGLLFLVATMVKKAPGIQALAMIVIALSCFSTYPHLHHREQATPNIVSVRGAAFQEKFTDRTRERNKMAWVFYATGGLALFGSLIRRSRLGSLSTAALIMGCIYSIYVGSWFHLRDAELYHPNVVVDPQTRATFPHLSTNFGKNNNFRSRQAHNYRVNKAVPVIGASNLNGRYQYKDRALPQSKGRALPLPRIPRSNSITNTSLNPSFNTAPAPQYRGYRTSQVRSNF